MKIGNRVTDLDLGRLLVIFLTRYHKCCPTLYLNYTYPLPHTANSERNLQRGRYLYLGTTSSWWIQRIAPALASGTNKVVRDLEDDSRPSLWEWMIEKMNGWRFWKSTSVMQNWITIPIGTMLVDIGVADECQQWPSQSSQLEQC